MGAATGVVGGGLRRGLGRAVVVVAVLDFSVPWHFRQSGGPQRPALGLPECARPRQYCWDRIAIVGAAIGAVGGHLRRDLGLAVVVVVGVTGGGVSYHLVGLSDPEDIKLLDDVDKMIAAHKERSGGAAADVGSAAAAADEPGGGVQAKKRRK